MGMRLTDRHEDSISIDGKEFEIDLAFDNVLRIYELQDEHYSNEQIIETMFEMFVIGHEDIELDIFQKKEIIEGILNTFIKKEEVQEKVQEPEETEEPQEPPSKQYDLNKDAEYIYASFLYDYKIDLFDVQGELHWNKFISLLNNLSKESSFMQVLHYRTCEIPKGKGMEKEAARVRKLKRIYALDKEDKKADDVFGDMAQFLGGGQVRKNG